MELKGEDTIDEDAVVGVMSVDDGDQEPGEGNTVEGEEATDEVAVLDVVSVDAIGDDDMLVDGVEGGDGKDDWPVGVHGSTKPLPFPLSMKALAGVAGLLAPVRMAAGVGGGVPGLKVDSWLPVGLAVKIFQYTNF